MSIRQKAEGIYQKDLPFGILKHWREYSARKRVTITLLIEITGIALVVGVLLGITAVKANAQCTPANNPDTICPTPAKFVAKWQNGFFTHADGLPASKVFAAPAKAHDTWTDKWVTYYLNHPGQQAGLAEHAVHVFNSKHAVVLAAVARWQTRSHNRAGVCSQIPFTPNCMAQLEWVNMLSAVKCGGWHTFPDLTSQEACNRFRNPKNDRFLTQDEFSKGIHMVGCSVGTGVAVVTAVGSGGTLVPLLFAGLAVTECTVTFWEVFS